LAEFRIGYEHIAELGGLRGKGKAIDSDINGFWQNRSFHTYADYALTSSFRSGLDQLIALGRERRCAMMCSEAVCMISRPPIGCRAAPDKRRSSPLTQAKPYRPELER
jgi:hypothetical protein